MARPTKLTADVQAKLVTALGRGASYALACKYAGISYSAFHKWLATAANANHGPKYELMLALEAAEAEAAMEWLGVIDRAMAESWQAAAWKLERRYPQDYGRSVHEVAGPDGGPPTIVVELVGVDLEKL